MFLREKTRTKDGKTHRYWSVVENRRVMGGGVVQRQVLYLGELNDSQRAGWVRTIEAVGWGCICGIFWSWMHFGENVCRQAVRGRVG
ncbi:MAG: hypothetical protein HYV59_07435 [Planctomycetes bacterium]|nr:hypothetical protein [Planctomycetota bacterium]